jgi:hypothetical protein
MQRHSKPGNVFLKGFHDLGYEGRLQAGYSLRTAKTPFPRRGEWGRTKGEGGR